MKTYKDTQITMVFSKQMIRYKLKIISKDIFKARFTINAK